MKLSLPMPENIANARMHWRVKDNARQAYFETCDAMQAAKLIPGPPKSALRRVRCASVMYLGSRMDHDNAMARHKWPMDWLQSRGYVKNDRDVEWEGLPQQVVKRDGKYRIELTLTPTAP